VTVQTRGRFANRIPVAKRRDDDGRRRKGRLMRPQGSVSVQQAEVTELAWRPLNEIPSQTTLEHIALTLAA
jgi:hypothetical protein